jgi:hypothetical protein
MNISIINAFNGSFLKMSATSDYLNNLCRQHIAGIAGKADTSLLKINEVLSLKTVTESKQPQLEISDMVFNMYAVDNVFFNRKSKNIIFSLKHNMQDLFVYDNNIPYKLSNETKIFATAFKQFLFIPIKGDKNIDAIMYKDT